MYSTICVLNMLSTGGTSLSKADTVPDLMELPVSWRESHELCDN